MLSAIVWGLVQGLTEFLPVSSSGHLVIVPEYLELLGAEVEPTTLEMSAFLHLGTLVAVLAYFHRDVLSMLRAHRDPEGRRILMLVLVGTIPALVGLFLEEPLQAFQENVTNVGWALIGTGVVLVFGHRLATGTRVLTQGRVRDALTVGVAQALALIPGISRSGMTISAGNAVQFHPLEAARYSFLLGIPAIAGGGLLQIPDLAGAGQLGIEAWVGLTVAAVAGYAGIALLLAALRRVGLLPFAAYCLAVGLITVLVF
ncbi:MAG: undecaprenyl-diphosphate phosphatase [Acidimicrobiia bacterium]